MGRKFFEVTIFPRDLVKSIPGSRGSVVVREHDFDSDGKYINPLKEIDERIGTPSDYYRIDEKGNIFRFSGTFPEAGETLDGQLEVLPDVEVHYPFVSYFTEDKFKAEFFAHASYCGFRAGIHDRERQLKSDLANMFHVEYIG